MGRVPDGACDRRFLPLEIEELSKGDEWDAMIRRLQTDVASSVAAAFVAHGTDIGWRGVMHVHPAQSVREAIGFLEVRPELLFPGRGGLYPPALKVNLLFRREFAPVG